MRKLSKYLLGIVAVIAIVAIGNFPAFALGTSPMALVAAATAAATPFATQVKLLAIGGSVYALLQVVKQVFPVAGLGAVLVNIALSILGVVVVVRPEELFSLNTLTAVGIAAITAAGAHGTIKSFTSSSTPTTNPAVRSGVAMLLCVALVGGLTGCSPVEVQAYRIIVGAKAFTTSIGNSHQECGARDSNQHWVSAHNASEVCSGLDKAISAKDVMIDLTELYCSGPEFETGGACNPPTDKGVQAQLVAKVKFAIQNYEQTETDLKSLLH
jgi:hypothetical protein